MNKMAYIEPKVQTVIFQTLDIVTSSVDPFFGEEDLLGNESEDGL